MMEPALPKFYDLILEKNGAMPASWDFDPDTGLVLLLPEARPDAVEMTPWADFLTSRFGLFADKSDPVSFSGPGGVRLAVGFLKDGMSVFTALTMARKLLAPLLEDHFERIYVISLLEDSTASRTMGEALVAAAHAALFELPKITAKPEKESRLQSISFFGDFEAADFRHAESTAEGNNLARWLTHLPGNYLTPGIYRRYAECLAETEGWDVEFLSRDQLTELGAGAFLSVVEASPKHDAGILRLKYRPGGVEGRPFALVGKGICFDTGGTNLKNGPGMLGMHGDMQGSAVALGTLLALTRLEFSQPVDCWLALAENHIGPLAVKCNDVITALSGTTVELINTDAEGRMVLADTLTLASRENPRIILDYATLTGSIVAALGHRMAGAMTNRPEWIGLILQAGRDCGERVWPLPYEDDYDEDMKSLVADTLQCRKSGEGDHLYAARLLGRFVGDGIGWIHVDMASSGTHEGGLAHIPTDLQGFGVRFGVEWFQVMADS